MKLDKDKSYAFVRGLPGIAFEQDDKYYNINGARVGLPEPEPEPAEEPKDALPPWDWKVPDLEAVQIEIPKSREKLLTPGSEEEVVSDIYACEKCSFVGKSQVSLTVHRRHKGH